MEASAAVHTVAPASRLCGEVRLPGDKSISHRYALLAAIADGSTRIEHYAPGADCASTLACLAELGVAVERTADAVTIAGRGLGGLTAPRATLDCGNSGTTMRLLSGLLAAHPLTATLTGDASLRRRPMRRVIVPLERMGARVEADCDRPPLTVHGASLRAIAYTPDVPSAQVKSAVLLAGLHARGRTRVDESAPTRDHTERALRAFGAVVDVDPEDHAVSVEGRQRLRSTPLRVPGDISSAVFWGVAAAGLAGSSVELREVGLNPSRTAVLDVLRRVGAEVEATVDHVDGGEPVGTIRVRHGRLGPLIVHPAEVPGLIDELPALAALGTFGGGMTVTGAAELRGKESDRITALVSGLKGLGAEANELADGFTIAGRRVVGGHADAAGDHRLAMAFTIAALGGRVASRIAGAEAVAVSYPEFFDVLSALSA